MERIPPVEFKRPIEEEVDEFLTMLYQRKTWEIPPKKEKPRSRKVYGSDSCGHPNLNDNFVRTMEMELDIAQEVPLDTCSTVKDMEELPKDFQVQLDLNNGTSNWEESADARKMDTIDESEK